VHGLIGPCISLDTACSSALVAFHGGVLALQNKECFVTVTGGVSVLTESASEAIANAGMMSPLGRCHTFDRRADGYCRSEGCGVISLSSFC